jgi:hypothetical protein
LLLEKQNLIVMTSSGCGFAAIRKGEGKEVVDTLHFT